MKILLENVAMSENIASRENEDGVALNMSDRDIAKATMFQGTEHFIDCGDTGYFESIVIKDKDNIELIFQDAIVKLKIRD